MKHQESTRQALQERGVVSVNSSGRVGLLRLYSPRACARLPIRRLVLLFGGAAVIGGCVLSTTTLKSGVPLDPAALSQIRLGETTGTEVMRLLGPPHSIIRGSARFREAGSLGCYSYARDRQLSSLDDKHYALFYRYDRGNTRSGALLIVSTTERHEVRFQGKEVLIILESERDVVTDVASRLGGNTP